MARTQTRTRKGRKNTEQRAAEAAALRARFAEFEEGQDEVSLAAMFALHDGYSERNAALIAMQSPEATDVAGYRAWQDRGRQVAEGQHGIRILAPAGHCDAVEATEDTEGQAARQFFHLVSVFDVTQTITKAEADIIRAQRTADRLALAS